MNQNIGSKNYNYNQNQKESRVSKQRKKINKQFQLKYHNALQQQEEMEFQNQNNVELDEMSYEQLQELQEKMGFVSRGLMQHLIQILLKQFTISNQTVYCCIIFLEESENSVEIQLECGHVFHKECISEWLSREKHFPVCKRDIDLRKLK